jgi:hypothetical protein
VFKRHGFPRLAVTALAALFVAGVLAAGAASAADTPKPASTEVVKKEQKSEPAAVVPAAPKAPGTAAMTAEQLAARVHADRVAADGVWAQGSSWLSFMAGYARAGGKNAGDAMGGYGVGYRHMMSNKWSFGAQIRHEVLGHMGPSYEISVPFTAEFTRHMKWKTAIRPYLGVGGGYYFHKYYRTGSDYTGAPGGGWHISTGADLPLDDRHVLGLDARVGFVAQRGENVVNPVFGPESSTMSQWSVKLTWALVH